MMQDTIIKNAMKRADGTKDFCIEKNYRNNEALRASFNRLAEKTFGLNFENWYRNGFWKDNYIPYSVVIDGEVVSNVSVNACNMNYKGKIVKLVQLGTIMTDDDYRGKGYAKALMEEVLKDYDGKVDGIYLFANDSVLEFYPKFGFREAKEYQFTKDVTISGECTAQNVPLRDKIDFDRTVEILDTKKQNAQLYMVDNPGLYMFYLSQFMTENLFYIEECNSYAIAEIEEDTLILHTILGNGAVDEVIRAFGSQVKKVILCFTPNDASGYEKSELHEEDTTFFVQGKFFEDNRGDEYMMQAITHA
ncbi:Acetyltransferase (GNAT) domain-containing protein [Butyrivibrio proteoclasticus]|uniref:Acetyltransferase (GNAT) domain-containing protein n=1 Tax=Butyrivibrio proteoclasticus TaxID=43305 RepID=A0A1I5RXP6_9FIRM|nr:GNAT family N-acetyltransferase [Butyrivibrio proteoclasticus]SFP63298.1 Acetyltransferase (GNAT) domain-containing protein [Butyrivibrio proteoclasticus]